jgi:hypothetical protein
MAKLTARGRRVVWRAEKTTLGQTLRFAMRSDYTLLIRPHGMGWKFFEAKVYDMTARRKAFEVDGYKILMGDGSEPKAFRPLQDQSIISSEQQVAKSLSNSKESSIMYTKESVKDASTADLIAAYNKLTGKAVKKFASRDKAEAQVLKAQAKGEQPAPKAKGAKQPKATKPRKVSGNAGATQTGRPKGSFIVKLTETKASSKPNPSSLRTQVIELLRKRDDNSASIEQLEKQFNRNMRGVVGKLIQVKWLQRVGSNA